MKLSVWPEVRWQSANFESFVLWAAKDGQRGRGVRVTTRASESEAVSLKRRLEEDLCASELSIEQLKERAKKPKKCQARDFSCECESNLLAAFLSRAAMIFFRARLM